MKKNLENSKIFGAIFVAGIVAMLSGFVANTAVHSENLAEDAYPIEVAETDIPETAPIIVAQAETSSPEAVTTEVVEETTASPAAEATTDVAAEATPSLEDLIAAADVAKGKKLSKACAACHTFDNGGKHKIGPNLFNVVNSPKGSKADFKYSKNMLSHGGTWNIEDLNTFLWKPKKFIKGTKMSYAGLKKDEDRAAIIKYLQSLK